MQDGIPTSLHIHSLASGCVWLCHTRSLNACLSGSPPLLVTARRTGPQPGSDEVGGPGKVDATRNAIRSSQTALQGGGACLNGVFEMVCLNATLVRTDLG